MLGTVDVPDFRGSCTRGHFPCSALSDEQVHRVGKLLHSREGFLGGSLDASFATTFTSLFASDSVYALTTALGDSSFESSYP